MLKALTVAILLVGTGFVVRVDAAPKTTRLWVDLLARKVHIDDGAQGASLGEGYYRVVHADETTEIVIKHANPLLFKYSFDVTATSSDSAAATETFAKAFADLLSRFGNKAASMPTPVVEGLDFGKFRTQISTTFVNVDSIRGWIDMSLDPSKQDELREDTKGLSTFVDETSAAYVKALEIHLKCMRGESLAAASGTVPCSAPVDFGPLLSERQAAAAFGLAAARLDTMKEGVAPVLKAEEAVVDARTKFEAAQRVVTAAGTKATAAQKKSRDAGKTTLDAVMADLATARASSASASAARRTAC